jgi:hypothetical protein
MNLLRESKVFWPRGRGGQNMSDLCVDRDRLLMFENGLNTRAPENSVIPATVLGYGEISTVLSIGSGDEARVAYKRLALFETEEEMLRYQALYTEYVHVLTERIGLTVASSETVRLTSEKGRHVLYIVQERYPSESIGHKAIHRMPAHDVVRFVVSVLRETYKVFAFNWDHAGELEIGFDGQISNWAIASGYDSTASRLFDEYAMAYFDTSTPLMQKNGKEQLDPELFLRNAPSFLAWIIRMLFLEDVMTRYYEFRQVAVDLVANFYKEQRSDLVPVLVEAVNEFFSKVPQNDLRPLSVDEIKAYYREDAWIWRIYLAARKADRFLHQLTGKDYAYILPGKIRR